MSGPEKDTAVGDTVIIQVPSDPPYGIILEADPDGNACIVKAFEKLPGGKFGVLQKHGGIHYGDVIFAVNDILLDTLSHDDAKQVILDRNILKKVLKFCNYNEYIKRKSRMSGKSIGMSQGDIKNSFLSIVKRTRVSTDVKGSKYAEYEVSNQWRVCTMRVQKEIVYKWSVWKRYSDFDTLHNKLKLSLGWQMEQIDIAPSHTFAFNKLSPEFIEQRKDDLNAYWQKIISIKQITEFSKHHCSADIKAFLDVDETIRSNKTVSSGVEIDDDSTNNCSNDNSRRDSSKKHASLARRRLSNKGNTATVTTASTTNNSSSNNVSGGSEDSYNNRPAAKSNNSEYISPVSSPPPPPPRPASVMVSSSASSTPSAPSAGSAPPPRPASMSAAMPPRPAFLGAIAAMRKD